MAFTDGYWSLTPLQPGALRRALGSSPPDRVAAFLEVLAEADRAIAEEGGGYDALALSPLARRLLTAGPDRSAPPRDADYLVRLAISGHGLRALGLAPASDVRVHGLATAWARFAAGGRVAPLLASGRRLGETAAGECGYLVLAPAEVDELARELRAALPRAEGGYAKLLEELVLPDLEAARGFDLAGALTQGWPGYVPPRRDPA